ncbi:olfactory receptor 2D3-like [Ambystoma mexicanum]|uniref:olfactory receptor 2D3-like n=1 Tax=Ambystoma mexicanum TaxID=8296 RepID=UPI0037E773FB
MESQNISSAPGFLLLGLSEHPKVQVLLFVFFLIIYLATILGNTVLITACVHDSRLHTPMYFFLVNLSFLDICYSTVTVPNMLVQLLYRSRMSYSRCAAQMYTYLLLGCTECVLLAVMGYDRYVAISFPLRYTVIMRMPVSITLAACCWFIGSLMALLDTVFTLELPLCASNVINHFFCEATALLKMACSDTYVAEMVIFSVGIFVLLIPSLFTLISYVRIIATIMGIRSTQGRYKAFSTCASHLTVVTIFYSTAIFMYMKPVSKNSANMDKMISVFYTVTPPMMNPVIYSLRNKDVKMALQKITQRGIFP